MLSLVIKAVVEAMIVSSISKALPQEPQNFPLPLLVLSRIMISFSFQAMSDELPC
jgi:hypothetical protein